MEANNNCPPQENTNSPPNSNQPSEENNNQVLLLSPSSKATRTSSKREIKLQVKILLGSRHKKKKKIN